MPITHNICDGTEGDLVFDWKGVSEIHQIPNAKTSRLWLFRWKLTPVRVMHETTPINVDSEEFRPGHERWQLAFSGYIDQSQSPGWFNEVIFGQKEGGKGDVQYANVTLRTCWEDSTRKAKGDFWVERMDWTVAVDAPNQIDGVLKGTGDLVFSWENT